MFLFSRYVFSIKLKNNAYVTDQIVSRRHKKESPINTRAIHATLFRRNVDELTILVGYDVWIDVVDRLLGLRVHRGGCTCIRRLAYDGSVLWTSGSAGGVLPVERRQDSSNGQAQKGRHGCQAQQQRIQHRCIGVACRDSRCKMLDQLELLSISPERYSYSLVTQPTPFFSILHFIQYEIELRNL